MKVGKKLSPSEVDFWLDIDRYSEFIQSELNSTNDLVFNIDLIRLASIRSAISNFVRILTRKSIPVYFCDSSEDSVNIRGKEIHISAKINTKRDFDVAVGLALHEAGHTLLTDFDMAKQAWANIPHRIFVESDKKNIRRASLEKFIHTMWNIVEDRYIDNYVFNEAPGYRGYYVALYDHDLNCEEVSKYLESDLFRYPSLKSYIFRIANFTNESTDLMALPRLDDIARTIDISHIDRLSTTKDRLQCAFDITEIVLDCIDIETENNATGNGPSNKQKQKEKRKAQGLADPSDFFDFGDAENVEPHEIDSKDDLQSNQSEDDDVDVGKKMIGEISDILQGKDRQPGKLNENESAVNCISDDPLDKDVQSEIDKMLNHQREFLFGDLSKVPITPQQKDILDLIEKHGIILVKVELPSVVSGNAESLKIDSIVVQKMTKELVMSGQSAFPLCGAMKMGKDDPEPPDDVAEAVKKGIALGTKLGRKLKIRSEVSPLNSIHKKSGKINKRLLYTASFEAEDLFYKTYVEKYNRANLHITVDASSSMIGEKWNKTMTAVVAICKAASMIDNVHVTVSFRATQQTRTSLFPYVVLAYDSKIDKFSKIKSLFPYLVPNGCTPEGLALSSIMNLFTEISPDEEDRFLLNLSDGEPYFVLKTQSNRDVLYYGDVGVSHTKSQVDKIRRNGVQVLSYFISDSELDSDLKFKKDVTDESLKKNFEKMYGKDSKFINVEHVSDLSKTINDLFLIRQ